MVVVVVVGGRGAHAGDRGRRRVVSVFGRRRRRRVMGVGAFHGKREGENIRVFLVFVGVF